MQRRTLEGTDLSLSVVGMGCWAIGGSDWGPDVRDEDSVAAVHAALDEGIDWFDTAPIYGRGHADRLLRRALGARIRDVAIATKVGVRLDPATGEAKSDLTPAHVREDCEASLARLGVERIDLLQAHWPCELGTPLADTLGTLDDLRREGKVRAFGLCNYSAAGLRAALDVAPVASLQTPYSLVRREAEADLLPLCRERGVAVLAYETLCRGLLTAKWDRMPRFHETDLRARDPRFWGTEYLRLSAVARELAAAARRRGTTPAALAVAWAVSRPGITAAVVGAKTPTQILSSLGRGKT
jgi:aryl-alcohol dehydrogenase-like predicted oxidoreductase